MGPQPLTFRQFIKRLALLGAGPPFTPKPGEPMLIFAVVEQGYFARPRGKTYPIIWREPDYLVPTEEIEACLQHLGFEGTASAAFWRCEDQPPQSPEALTSAGK